MTDIYAHRISNHAVKRFRERVRDVPAEKAKEEMVCCMETADQTEIIAMIQGKKKNVYLRTGCCVFVCEKGTIVTVIKDFGWKLKAQAENQDA